MDRMQTAIDWRPMEIAVLGAGAFGTALAKMFSEVPGRPHAVTLWVRRADAAAQLRETRESTHLPGAKLSSTVEITHDLDDAVRGKPIVVSVTPSHVVREVLGRAAYFLAPGTVVVSASKGIEQGTLLTIDGIYRDILPEPIARRAAFLSGPTFAKELVQGLPAAIVCASHDAESATLVQDQLGTERLRIYSTEDVTGVELGGALKNVFAIGAGIADGLGFGHNTRAALITRGLNEMARLGVAMGANPLTFAGLAGMGDLVLTCTGDLSRNRQVGLELGRGRSLADIIGSMNAVAEGVKTTKAAHDLGVRQGVELPIVDAIYSVVEHGVPAAHAVTELLKREVKAERL
jgi:glycerol-3-phosphate dehydrogenase (NAD(P)+)